MHQQFGAGIQLEFFTPLTRQRANPTGTTDQKPDACALAAADNAAENCTRARADRAAFERLLAAAAGLHATLFIGSTRVFSINSGHIAVHDPMAAVSQI